MEIKKHYNFNVFVELLQLTDFFNILENPRYQSVARDSGGKILENYSLGVRVEIYKGGEGDTGINIYTEIHEISSNKYGLITFNFGEGRVIIGDFSIIDWDSDVFFAKIELDATGGIF